MAAAAYAAVVSLMHLTEEVQLYNARRPIFDDVELRQIESLQERVHFLQDFLEGYHYKGSEEIADAVYTTTEDIMKSKILNDIHRRQVKLLRNKKNENTRSGSGKNVEVKGLESGNNNEVKDLESQIAELVYAAEYIIETHVVDHIHHKITISHGNMITLGYKSSIVLSLSQDLLGIIKIMDFINKKVMKIKEESGFHDHESRDLAPMHSLGPPQTGNDIMVGFDDQILDMLIGRQSSLQIIPIYGMGGIGKTTLAKNAYDHQSIIEHFHVSGWITVSQEYIIRDMLLCLLHEIGGPTGDEREELERSAYHHLGENLHKLLSGRRYFIIMDDMWSTEAWDKLKLFFPDNNNGSRIIVTTRLSHVANSIGHSNLYEMNPLDESASWNLLRGKIFAQNDCPSEMEEIGRKIAKNCKGLPLSIVVIGGLLAKSKMTCEYWEYIAENISTTVNSENNDRCEKILSLSYNQLSIHLKPCFLYFGVYPEDHEIRVSKLIQLWVAEGFLKPHGTKDLEEVAKDYLKDLIDRNLIFVSMFGSTGDMKYCKIHDLLRELCLRQAQKEKFVYVTKVHNNSGTSQDMNSQRRVAIHLRTPHEKNSHQAGHSLQFASFTRSLTSTDEGYYDFQSPNFKLLKVLNIVNISSILFSNQFNLRYLSFQGSICLDDIYWNLQTVIYSTKLRYQHIVQNYFWKMLQIRHVIIDSISLPDPPYCQMDEKDDFVLKNLQTLSRVQDFRCTSNVLQRIPNIKKLKIEYSSDLKTSEFYCLNNLSRLRKLQSLEFLFFDYRQRPSRSDLCYSLEFPHSLKKLSLRFCILDWEDMTTKIGSLPNLEKLKLESCFGGDKWSPIEDQFLRLKFLQIKKCDDLVYWTVDSSHFPCLERLSLVGNSRLKEIPYGIGDIQTLKLIQLDRCNKFVVASAREILDEQQSLGNEDFHLIVW